MNVVLKIPRHTDAEREKVQKIVERKREKIRRNKGSSSRIMSTSRINDLISK